MSDQTEVMDRLKAAIQAGARNSDLLLAAWKQLGAAQAREEALLGLLRQGRAILSNDANVKIQGDLIGQVIFGDWSAKVDAALAASEPPGTAEGEEGT